MEIRQHQREGLFTLRTTWLAAASSGWLSLVLASPFAPAPLAFLAYAVGGLVCHQIAERSFHIGAAQLAVCARCTGIYAGAAGSFVWQAALAYRNPGPATRTPGDDGVLAARLWLMGGALPTVATVLLEQVGLWNTTNVERAIAGVPLGAVVALVAGRAATIHLREWRQRRPV